MKGLCLLVTIIVLTSVSAWTQTPANDYLDDMGLAS